MTESILQSIRKYAALRKTLENRLKDFLAPLPYGCLFYERHYLLQSLIRASSLMRPGPMLDVGCGMKPYSSVFAKTATPHLGIDYPDTSAGSYGKFTSVDVWASSLDLPFADRSFESVLCSQVLEHVPDPLKTLTEITRVLRPGGTLVLAAPMCWPIHEAPHDYFRYTQYGLRSLFAQAGLEVICEERRGNSVTTLAALLSDLYLAVKPGRPKILKYTAHVANLFVFCAAQMAAQLSSSTRLNLGWTFVARKK